MKLEPEILKYKYKTMIAWIRTVARDRGYAIGVHGSLKRDLDLIAVPWVDEEWIDTPDELAHNIARAVNGIIHKVQVPTQKPHGRVAYTIHLHDVNKGWIDLSIIKPKEREDES